MRRLCLIAGAVLLIGGTLGASRAEAMPMFARKYEVGCCPCQKSRLRT